MILHIDTSEIDTVRIAIGKIKKSSRSKIIKSQMLLPLIENALRENNLTFADITEIIVHTGPGSFTGLRVGATVANALGYLLKIPVNGKRALVIPSY